MNDRELADEIERHLKDTESGDQWRAAPLVSFWRGQWQQIIAALRRGHEPLHDKPLLRAHCELERPPSGEVVMVPRRLSADVVMEIANQTGIGAAAIIDAHNLMLSLSTTKGRKS